MNILNFVKNIAKFREKAPITSSIFAGIIVGVCFLGIVMPQSTNADLTGPAAASYIAKAANEAKRVAKTIKVVITAYSSSPEETDDTPLITASGKMVADGIIANNMLPFGTKVRIPSLYGDKIFVVQDRMARHKSDYHIDIWMPSKPLAINFGAKTAEIEVLQD